VLYNGAGDDMKRGTPIHPKMQILEEELQVERPTAVGIMELLWQFTAQFAKAGNIGKWSNAHIAQSIYWRGDPDKLIAALVKSHWIDKNDKHRLIIHDWYEHCEDAVHMALSRATELFADGKIPKMNRLQKPERDICEARFNALVSAQRAHSERTVSAQNDIPCAVRTPESAHTQAHNDERTAFALALPKPLPKPLPQPAASDTAVDDNIAFLWSEYYAVLKTEITKRKETWTTPSNSTTKTIIEIGQQVGMKKMLDIIPLYFNFLIEKKLAFQWNNANGFVLQLPQLLKSIQLPSEQGRSQTLIWQDEACRQFESKYNETLPRNEKGDYQILNWYMDNYFKDEKRSGYNAILKIYKEISNGH